MRVTSSRSKRPVAGARNSLGKEVRGVGRSQILNVLVYALWK